MNELTSKLEKRLSYYWDKWSGIALNTDAIDERSVEADIWPFLQWIGMPQKNKRFIYLSNPLFAGIVAAILPPIPAKVTCQGLRQIHAQFHDQLCDQLCDQIYSQILTQTYDQISDQISDQILTQIRAQIHAQIHAQIYTQISAQLCDQIHAQFHDQISAQLCDQIHDQVHYQPKFYFPYLAGSFDNYFFALYDFFIHETNALDGADLRIWNGYAKTTSVGPIYLTNEYVIVSAKPKEIHIKDGVLHNETGPSIHYDSAVSVYSLNGVRVPRHLVDTKADDLDPNLVVTERNAEIRRERQAAC
jgi:hypothetical protein